MDDFDALGEPSITDPTGHASQTDSIRQVAGRTPQEILRGEIQNFRMVGVRVVQWGVTVLVAVMTINYYIRRDFAQHHTYLLEKLKKGDLEITAPYLPLMVHLIGTGILLILSAIFCFLTIRIYRIYSNYQRQLHEIEHAIRELPLRGAFITLLVVVILYLLFPGIDILIRYCVKWYYISEGYVVAATATK